MVDLEPIPVWDTPGERWEYTLEGFGQREETDETCSIMLIRNTRLVRTVEKMITYKYKDILKENLLKSTQDHRLKPNT